MEKTWCESIRGLHVATTTAEAGTEEMAVGDANANPTATTTKTESNLWRLVTPIAATTIVEARVAKMIAAEVARTTAATMEHAKMDIANRSGANADHHHPKVWVIRSLMKSADSTCSKAKTVSYTRVIW
jgi:hypothetical protein